MAIILQGRRAKRYLSIAKSKLDDLKRLSAQFLTAALQLPGGKAIIQKMGSQDRIMVNVRDPYILLDLRTIKDGAAFYRTHFGGITGEPFLSELTFEGASGLHTAGGVHVYNGNGAAVSALTTAIFIDETEVGTDPHTTTTLLKVGTVFVVDHYGLGIWSVLPYLYDFACNLRGQPIMHFEPAGEFSKGTSIMFATAIIEDTPGFPYHCIFRLTSPEKKLQPDIMWPPASLNDSRPHTGSIASTIDCYSRGNILFVESYAKDWQEDDSIPARAPDLVRLTEWGSVAEIRPLLGLMPELDAYKDGDDALNINVSTGFAWSGGDHITALISIAGTPGHSLLYRSTDAGGSWSHVSTLVSGEQVIYAGFTGKTIYSMYAGHVEYTTSSTTQSFRYVSTDHGATWEKTEILPTDIGRRDRNIAAPLVFKQDGTPGLYAALAQVGTHLEIHTYKGVSVSDQVAKLAVPGDYAPLFVGESVNAPAFCFFGSKEFPAPIKPGHPGALEYPV